MKGEKVSFISTTYKGHRLEGHTMCPVHRTYYFQLILNYTENYRGFDNTPSENFNHFAYLT